MERRTFVKSIGGLAIYAVFSAAGGLSLTGCSSMKNTLFTTPTLAVSGAELGPVMQGGIEMISNSSGAEGQHEGTSLFSVDELGTELIRLADGTQTIDEITRFVAESRSISLNPADVAQFYVTLGQSGYLANRVEVDLFEMTV